ncbi:MAG TPA: PIN domain-containing protein [Anaerolineae bacterium]|nr:PIN domain-containing protein [Anaerolineae bacterium]
MAQALRRILYLRHLHLVDIQSGDFYGMIENAMQYSLLPRDALHLAIMQRLDLTRIATDDADFDRVPGLQRYWVFNSPRR